MSRVIYGTRVSLEVGIIGTGIATVIGVALGVTAGFYRGWVDTVFSRIGRRAAVDPAAAARPRHRRGVRGPRLPERHGPARSRRDHLPDRASRTGPTSTGSSAGSSCRCASVSSSMPRVRSARRTCGSCSGRSCPTSSRRSSSTRRCWSPRTSSSRPALSFLGVGVRPPTASWGQMIAAATPIFNTAWWYMAFPGLALLLTVLAFNLLRRRTAGRAEPPYREDEVTAPMTGPATWHHNDRRRQQ